MGLSSTTKIGEVELICTGGLALCFKVGIFSDDIDGGLLGSLTPGLAGFCPSRI